MCTRNNNGPSTIPCGTPWSTSMIRSVSLTQLHVDFSVLNIYLYI